MKPTVRTHPNAVVIELEGEADLATVPEFQKVVREQMKAGVRRLIIDFAKVTFVNTPVWAVVVEYFQHASSAGTEFALTGIQGRVDASFKIVRLGDFITHLPTVEAALDAADLTSKR
ncbi:STAS domain-containing protein [Prosthecobacter fluviatilis]|uniref:STAS domain-containing protein n=1 Tax=Prosthecobacter fluviatilis TaxID=445931 RepID=A0ABW0KM25_9BACT